MKLFFVAVALLFVSAQALAQSKRKTVYDSSLVGDRITPAVSSVMMPKTFTEILLTSALSTRNDYFTSNSENLALNDRTSYNINTLQITHGISASGRFNIGLDISYRVGRSDADKNSSPFKVFGNDGDGLEYYARGFSSLGLRARYAVTPKRNFVIQHIFYIPFQKSTEDTRYLGDQRYAFNTQFMFNRSIGRKAFIFAQADVYIQFKTEETNAFYNVPINVFGGYSITRNLSPYARISMSNAFDKEIDLINQSFSYGFGLQYQFSTMFNINAFYSDVFAGKSYPGWNSYSLGLRVVL